MFERGKHAVLYGERGVGKTSLANSFHDFIGGVMSERILPIRKQASPEDTYTTLWRKVFRDLKYEIQAGSPPGFMPGAANTETISASDFYQGDIIPDDVVRELGKASGGKAPVIFFDEFEHLADASARRLMSHTVKSLSDGGVDATIVIVGVAGDVRDLVAEHESIKRNIEEIKMPRMSNSELNEILDDRLPSLGMKLHGDARWKIVTLSRGLPEYVHALGRDAAVNAIEGRRHLIAEDDVTAAIRKFVQQSDQSAAISYKKAIDSNKPNALHKHILLACALTRTDDEGKFVARDVVEPLRSILKRPVEIATFQTHLTAFCTPERGSILEKHGKKNSFKYRFREPKMQPYVLMQGIAADIVPQETMAILNAPEQPRLSSDF